MGTDFSFSFDRSKYQPEQLDKRLNRAIFGVAKYWDGRCESYMKQKAPWTDRTTNARNGLFARAVKEGAGLFSIILAHSVTYGIYLELPHTHERADGSTYTIGPNPIIVPTRDLYAPKVMRMLNKILDRL